MKISKIGLSSICEKDGMISELILAENPTITLRIKPKNEERHSNKTEREQ